MWRALLDEGGPLLLPAAHDALTARLIARAGFRAYSDIDLIHVSEENEAIRQVIAASR